MASLWWRAHFQMTLPTPVAIDRSWREARLLVNLAYDSVGKVGWLDTYLNVRFVVPWLVSTALVVLGAALRSRVAVRVVILAVLSWTVFTIALAVAVRSTGFQMQARYSLPLAAAGLLAVGLCSSTTASVGSARIIRAVTGVFGVAQMFMVLTAARRSALGLDGLRFSLDGAKWSPPVGWPVVLTLGGVGAFGVAALGWIHPDRNTTEGGPLS